MTPTKIELGNRVYYDRKLEAIKPPIDATIEVGTLTGFSDLLTALMPKTDVAFIHVVNPALLSLSYFRCNEWGDRQECISCRLPSFGRFAFGEYLGQEKFHIGLQSFFDQSPLDMDYLYRIAGNLTAEQINTSVDNGLSQTVGLRVGAVLADKVTAKRIVTLKPWRTFREIDQSESAFIFRLKNVQDNVPLLSLHVGDGEKWQLEAVRSIKTWLKEKHPDLSIVA